MSMIKRIMIPVDFSDYSKKALTYAVKFTKNFQAEIYLLYVIEPVNYFTDMGIEDGAGMVITDLDLPKRAKNELDKLGKQEIQKSVKFHTEVREGQPFIEIINYASEKDIDLIFIATHGHTGVQHLLFGSTAEKVVRKAPCPVLSIREPAKGFRFTG